MTNKARKAPDQQVSKQALAHGWQLYQHPLFEQQLAKLQAQVEKLKAKHPRDYKTKNTAKRLAAIEALIFDIIPQDPSREEYRQGHTLGASYKHWFRAKFFQQYRLFFRYHAASKIIVYAWVNDEDTKRAYESTEMLIVCSEKCSNLVILQTIGRNCLLRPSRRKQSAS
jgi:toxin YhaV